MVVRHTTRTAREANRCGERSSARLTHRQRAIVAAMPHLAANGCSGRQAHGYHHTLPHGRPAWARGRVGATGFPQASAARCAS